MSVESVAAALSIAEAKIAALEAKIQKLESAREGT